jgi:hypothetical protein
VKAAQLHALAAELAAGFDSTTSGVLAAEILPDLLGAVRQGELALVPAIERADRSRAFAVDGAASVPAFVRGLSGQSPAWASKRVQLGRTLADRMPVTGKTWAAGDLGMDHAQVIANTIRGLEPDLAADMEAFLAQQAGAGLSVTQLKIVAAELLAAAAPETCADEAARTRAAQRLCLSQTLDGRRRLDGWLDPEAGMIVSAEIAAFTANPTPTVTSSPKPQKRVHPRRMSCLGQLGGLQRIRTGPSSLDRASIALVPPDGCGHNLGRPAAFNKPDLHTTRSSCCRTYSPVSPSMRSRKRSAWPLCRAYSSIMWT